MQGRCDVPAQLGVAVQIAADDGVRHAVDVQPMAANGRDLLDFARRVPTPSALESWEGRRSCLRRRSPRIPFCGACGFERT